MIIDYLTVMLLGLSISGFTLAYFFYKGDLKDKSFVPSFFILGLLFLLTSINVLWTWPIHGSFNISFGEPAFLMGLIFTGMAVSLRSNYSLKPLSIFIFISGILAVMIGWKINNLHQTKEPAIAFAGYALLGGTAILMSIAFLYENKSMKDKGTLALRRSISLVAFVAGCLWFVVAMGAYMHHMQSFSKWKPTTEIQRTVPTTMDVK